MDNLTAIIPFWNGHDTIRYLLDSLPADLSVIVVDDLSDEPYRSDRSNVQVIRHKKRGYFSDAVNTGLNACRADVLLLNQDVWLEGDAWQGLLAAKREKYALIGDRAGLHPAWPMRYVHGTFMFMRRDAIERVGDFNAREYPLWGATCEWQLRACRKGFEVLLVDRPPWLHHEGRRGHGPRRRLGGAIEEAIKREPRKQWWFLRTPPAISVVMPCYNYGRYLSDAINSLVGGPSSLGDRDGQTFQSFEVIIVDDASTDGSQEIGAALADPWKGIHFVGLPKNLGTPGALNAGVSRAHGRLIHILSADDMREPYCLERLYRACQKNRHSVAYGHLRAFKGGKLAHTLRLNQYDFDSLLHRNLMPAGIMYPKKAWVEAGGYPTEMIHGREDWAFNIALGIHGWCGVHVGDSGNLVRREGQNRSVRTANKKYWSLFREQLLRLYPAVYAGDRMAGCCGGGPSPARSVPKGKLIVAGGGGNPGHANMIRLQYIGRSSGDMTFHGAVTRKRYVFGGVTRFGLVDERDLATGRSNAPGLLEITDARKRIFRRAPLPAKPPPEMEPEALVSQSDDLTAIKGVGPKSAERLRGSGLLTFVAVAGAKPEDLANRVGLSVRAAQKIVEAAGAFA